MTGPRAVALGLLCMGCAVAQPSPAPRAAPVQLRAALDSILGDPAFRAAIVGVLVVDAASGDTLYARNAHTALVPASNMKLVTGAGALVRLGPGYRFRTTFAMRGSVRDSVLDGDLLVFGRGDPTVSRRMAGNPLQLLAGIADSLRARGVARIGGRLVHAGNAFVGSPYGFGWSWGYLVFGYGAGVDELLYDEGAAFDPARAAADDTTADDTTATDTTTNEGRPDSPATDPAAAYMAALKFALESRGLMVTGGTARDPLAVPDGTDSSFDLLSPPLSEILAALQKPSQNQIAEILLRAVALEATGTGSDTAGTRIFSELLLEWGADSMEFILRDGSGLSRHNLLSPATVVRILLTMRSHEHYPYWYAALPAVGSEGTVRTWLQGTRASEVVKGKTGTLDMVRAFSGYATAADGRQLVFSFIANHYRTPTDRVTAAIQALLTTLTERPFVP